MPDNEDYRKYLDSRFEGLAKVMSAQFINIHDKLDGIEKQTTKTNNRVGKLEDKEVNHIINCPVAPKVDQIDKDLAEYRMIRKYPKIGVTLIAFTVILFIYSLNKIIHKQDVLQGNQNDLKSQVDKINTPMTDSRTGKTFLYPSGMSIDSVITR